MSDYASHYAAFDLSTALAALVGSDSEGWNAARECCDRWCGEGRIALRYVGDDGYRRTFTFEELREESSRLADLFFELGVRKGDRVAGLLPRKPALLATVLATWRLGAVYQPLFTAFGPKAIEHRLAVSGAKVIVTDPGNLPKLDGTQSAARIVVTEEPSHPAKADAILSRSLGGRPPYREPLPLALDDPFLMMFTSGTTGPAKALKVPLKAIAAFVAYTRDAVDLRAEDQFWNIADPGWAYGLYYGITGPLAMGHAILLQSASFAIDTTVATILEFGITNLTGAPTAFRQLVSAGPDAVRSISKSLRAVSSAGEPLNPDMADWFSQHLDVAIHDHYGQTELGMVVCNHHGLDHVVSAGSAGFPVAGHRIVVLDQRGKELPPGVPGTLAVDVARSPFFWFSGYEDDEASQAQRRYYLSGDTVELNPDGSISFVGRADDVITSSGYRIGPFDVESALLEHPSVAEVAVIGKPDPARTEIVKAFVVVRAGENTDQCLVSALQAHVKARLSAHAYPREIEFVDQLPKTPSGKIQRFLLRAREKAVAQSEAGAGVPR